MLHDALTLSLSPLPFVSPHEYVAPLHHLTPSSRELSLHPLTLRRHHEPTTSAESHGNPVRDVEATFAGCWSQFPGDFPLHHEKLATFP